MDMTEASAMTEASGLVRDQDGRETSPGERHGAEMQTRHPLERAAERLRKVTLAVPLPSLFVAFLLGVLVARRR